MTQAPTIDHCEVIRLVAEEGALVIDALPPEEYAKQHLPGAVNLPIQDFDSANVQDMDRDRVVITYCADSECDLSARAAARLQLEGFRRVLEFVGGISEWGGYGLDLEGDTASIARTRDLAARDLPTCHSDTPVHEIAFGEHTLAAVVDGDGVLLGRIRRDDGDASAIARDVMSPQISTFRPDVYLTEMAEWFKKRPKADEFIITTPDGRVFGVLYRTAVERVTQTARHAEPARP